MRFRKGSKVEVHSEKDAVIASWLCAEIISGNGRRYTVKYGWSPETNEAAVAVGRVPRKNIRPCPPPVEEAWDWLPGDLVEVFDNPAWKTAVVVEVLGGTGVFVRLIGSKTDFEVPKSHIRVRQCWIDEKWFLIGKGPEAVLKTRPREAGTKLNFDIEETQKSTLTLKRKSLPDPSEVLNHAVPVKKIKFILKDHSVARSILLHPSTFSQNVDAHITRQNALGEKDMNASFHDRTVMQSRMEVSSKNDRISVDIDSCSSSVGSCSTTGNDIDRLPSNFKTFHAENLDDYTSDAESSCGNRFGEIACSRSTNVELRTDFHRSELQAYSHAIQALYASGPLSWEDEIKLRSLRIRLHISVDEHQIELKNLDYNQIGLPLCCY